MNRSAQFVLAALVFAIVAGCDSSSGPVASTAGPAAGEVAPEAVDDRATTREEETVAIDVLANDSDPDGDPIRVTVATAASGATTTILADGRVGYTPPVNFAGDDTIAYTISDPTGKFAHATVFVTVQPVNDGPQATDDVASTPEDTPVRVAVLANDTDVDGDALVVVSAGVPGHGVTAVVGGSEIEYTPETDWFGTDSFTYEVSDGAGGTATASVLVTVTDAPDPPIARPDSATTDEDTAVIVDVLSNDEDPDGTTLTVTDPGTAANGSLRLLADGRIEYLPRLDFHGTDRFAYTVEDGSGASSTGEVTVTVNPVNDPPTLVVSLPSAAAGVSRGGLLAIELTATDPDDPVTVDIFADVDGDIATEGDRFPLRTGLVPPSGVPQSLSIPTGSVPLDTYRVVGRASDGTNPPVVEASSVTVELRNVAWASRVKGTGLEDRGRSVASLPDGSFLVAGHFSGSGDIGPSVIVSAGFTDVFVARYGPDGAVTWVATAGGTSEDSAAGIAAWPDGSSVVTGHFKGTATFGLLEPGETVLVSGGDADLFLARYGEDGSLVWAVRAGGPGETRATAVAAFPDGSCVVTGVFWETATFGPGEANETTLTAVNAAAGNSDAFVARYDASGALLWARSAGGDSDDEGRGIAALPDGSAAVVGAFESDSVTFGEGANAVVAGRTGPTRDLFVARYGSDGTLAWLRTGGAAPALSPPASAVTDGASVAAFSDGSLALAGSFTGPATLSPGRPDAITLPGSTSSDVFVLRYRADGALLWARAAGGSTRDAAHGVAARPDGSCAVTGYFVSSATFGAGEPGETTLAGVSMKEVFVALYGADGGLHSAVAATGDRDDEAFAIASAVDGSLAATGTFGAKVTFGAGDPNETELAAHGGTGDDDVFVARYNADLGF